jgi:5-methyltetrahydrofolate--homocysteine methyltransferase
MAVIKVYEAVLSYDEAEVKRGVEQALSSNVPVGKILSEGLISAMDEVGKQFSEGNIFVPEMLMAAEAMKVGMKMLKPLMVNSGDQSEGTVVIGTVKGDLHDIGKNLVTIMLEGGGFNVVDLGVDVSADTFVEVAIEKEASVVALSALLTTTMPSMRDTVVALQQAGIKNTIIGGAPVTQKFADDIGAAGYSLDAPGAVTLTRMLLQAS